MATKVDGRYTFLPVHFLLFRSTFCVTELYRKLLNFAVSRHVHASANLIGSNESQEMLSLQGVVWARTPHHRHIKNVRTRVPRPPLESRVIGTSFCCKFVGSPERVYA